MSDLRVSEIRFLPATATERATGLLGFVSFLINDGLRLDGITVRKTLAGDVRLSWPVRTASTGGRHPLIRPVTDEARRDMEAQVLGALGIGTGLASPAAPTGQTERAP
jgi:hypothetical protein